MPQRRARWRLAAVLAAALLAAGGIVAAVLVSGGGSGRRGEVRRNSPTTTSRPASTSSSTASPRPPFPAGPPGEPAPAGEEIGVNVNRLFNDRTFTAHQIQASLTALQRTGATVARSDALWEAGEPAPPRAGVHRYHWAFDDLLVAVLAEHGLRWLPIIDYTAPWAQSIPGQDHSPPRSPADYGAFAAALAARYGVHGAFWRVYRGRALPVETLEIWNEPDIQPFWVPAPNAAQYDELYFAARDAVKAVQPAARVIIGGLANAGNFLPAMVAARPDLRGHVDGIAFHPYAANPFAVLADVRSVRRLVRSLGFGEVPIYATEFGWTTSPPGARHYAPERVRPGYIRATIAALGHTDCGLAGAFLYTWVTPERNPAQLEDWFGIEPPSGGASRDVAAFTEGLRRAQSPGQPIHLCA